jgi:hypothetical protein
MLVMVGALRGQPGRARWVPALGPHWGVLLDSGPFWGEQSRVMFSTVPGGCLQPHHLAEVTLVPGLRLPLPGFQVPVHFYNLITFANSAAATATVRELGKRCHTRHAPPLIGRQRPELLLQSGFSQQAIDRWHLSPAQIQ